MNHIIVDLEATCWKSWKLRNAMEIIEIGAVKLSADLEELAMFGRFVKPVIHPQLSSFCTKLTSITQEEVDKAAGFSAVFSEFMAWVGPEPYYWYSWGDFDCKQFGKDLAYHQLAWPERETHYTNLKYLFADQRDLPKPVGMMKALRMLEIEFSGRHHRGIDDAKHIAQIAKIVLKGKG